MSEPLCITAYPRCGIECDGYLPIDSILFYEVMRRLNGPQILTTPGRNPDARMPQAGAWGLAKTEIDGVWFYAASFAQWGPHTDGRSHWNKRFDQQGAHLVDFRGRRGKVIVEEGRYKAYHMPQFYRHALWVSWFVVGDRPQIENLLSTITHIGKKAAQGMGRVNRWQVTPWREDWSVYGEGGRLMRGIPDSNGILYGVRPSYWDSRNQVLCKLPDPN